MSAHPATLRTALMDPVAFCPVQLANLVMDLHAQHVILLEKHVQVLG